VHRDKTQKWSRYREWYRDSIKVATGRGTLCNAPIKIVCERIESRRVEISLRDKRKYILRGKNVITTQDWRPAQDLVNTLGSLVRETHVIGSSREPGLIVDAIREGAQIGLSI
jgi:hypothetical protein